MKVLYMLDTNMVSYIAKGHSKAARTRMLNLEQDEAVCLSVITEAEILCGLREEEMDSLLHSAELVELALRRAAGTE